MIRQLALGLAVAVLAPAAARAQSADQDAPRVEASTVENEVRKWLSEAQARGTEASADPFTVADSTHLFTRPTVGEIFKISAETHEKVTTFSVVGTPARFLDRSGESRLWSGLQTTLAYGYETREATAGLKLNYSLQDPREFSDLRSRQELQRASDTAFEKCWKQGPQAGEADVDRIERCGKKGLEAMREELKKMAGWRPSFSAGVSLGRNFLSNRWGKFAANAAVEVPVETSGLSIIGNANAESFDVVSQGRRWTTGGAVAVSWQSPSKIELSFTGKYVACLAACDADSSYVEFGPRAEYPLSKDVVLAAGITWRGKDTGIGGSLAGLALAYTFGPEAPK